jgi:hypothetical protein
MKKPSSGKNRPPSAEWFLTGVPSSTRPHTNAASGHIHGGGATNSRLGVVWRRRGRRTFHNLFDAAPRVAQDRPAVTPQANLCAGLSGHFDIFSTPLSC